MKSDLDNVSVEIQPCLVQPPVPDPLNCAANRWQILEELQTVDRQRPGTLIEQFFVKTRKGKTMRQGPFYVWQRDFGSTDYLCICTNNPSPPSDGP